MNEIIFDENEINNEENFLLKNNEFQENIFSDEKKETTFLNFQKSSIEYLLYILIFLFWLNLIVLVLKKEKLM